MDPGKIVRQMWSTNKSAFENTFRIIHAIQEQSGKVFLAFVEKSPWITDKISAQTADLIGIFIKGCDDLKAVADDHFQNMEAFILELESYRKD
jgi:hypothetical protein